MDVFNLTNENTVMQEVTVYGSRLGTPQEILQGRIARVGIQLGSDEIGMQIPVRGVRPRRDEFGGQIARQARVSRSRRA